MIDPRHTTYLLVGRGEDEGTKQLMGAIDHKALSMMAKAMGVEVARRAPAAPSRTTFDREQGLRGVSHDDAKHGHDLPLPAECATPERLRSEL